MSTLIQPEKPGCGFSLLSSIEADVWNGPKKGSSYEWWYFDALSDDENEAVVIIFLDNFVFSPRYNAKCSTSRKDESDNSIPAVAFFYYRDGKPVYRSVMEYSPEDFEADQSTVGCKIGKSSFRFKTAPYGSGYMIEVELPISRGRRIQAKFEWLSVESDLFPKVQTEKTDNHSWNMVAPRSDVTGTIKVIGRRNKKKIKFRGTGYHDHNSDTRWMPETIEEWFWGRFHFPVATAVFYRYKEKHEVNHVSKLIMISDGAATVSDAEFRMTDRNRRDKFGLEYPVRFDIESGDVSVTVERHNVLDSSFFYLRFLSEMELKQNGETVYAKGIGEYLKPQTLAKRWIRPLVNMRIGRDGKSAFLP